MCCHDPLRCILPPGILRKLATNDSEDVRKAALSTLAADTQFRIARAEAAARRGGRSAQPITFARIGGKPQRTICDQQHGTDQTPGKVIRAEGAAPVDDEAINQAYDGLGATYQLYWETFRRDSIDGQDAAVRAVHYDTNYDNAFWDNAGHMFSATATARCSRRPRPGSTSSATS
jgi:Zn-dependent metalloprotease